jgi:superfamily I DNA/RNA helicase
MKVSPDDWVPIGVPALEPAALESVKSTSNLLVIAGPGAGKTELLAQKACFLLQTYTCHYPKRILAISFKKDSASNLKDRVEKRTGEKNIRFDSMTFDGFAKSILDNFNNILPLHSRPQKKYEIAQPTDVEIQTFLKTLHVQGLNDTKPLIEIINANQWDRRRLVDNFTKKHFTGFRLGTINRNHILDWASDQLWLELIKGNENGSKISFQMISRLAEYIVNLNHYIKKSILATYSHVFLEEFQDTTSIQYDFVRTCFYQTSTILTAVGDGKQRIMTWAGARTSIFDDFKIEFAAQEKTLTMNFRCAPRLVELQTVVAKHLEPNSTPQKTNSTGGGTIKSIDFKNESQEADSLTKKVLQLIQNGVGAEQICFLFKQQVAQNSTLIIQQLNNAGVKARVEDEYQDLLKDDAVKIALTFIRYVFELDVEARDEAFKLIADSDASLADFRRIEQRLATFRNNINSNNNNFSTEETTLNFLSEIYTFLGNQRLSILVQGFSESSLNSSAEKFANKFYEIFSREKNVRSTVDEFVGIGVIPCMSIHKSKGLEFEVVFFIGLESGMFWNFQNQPKEDIQAFFVAISRPKSQLYLTFCKQRGNRNQQKSMQQIYNFLTVANVENINLSGATGV